MKTRLLAQMLGIVIGGLALAGLFAGEGRLFRLINIDLALDLLRIPVAGALLYAGFWAKDNLTINNIVLGVGVIYVGIGVLGAMSPTLFDILPNGLTSFDIAFHIVVGTITTIAGLMHREHRTLPAVVDR